MLCSFLLVLALTGGDALAELKALAAPLDPAKAMNLDADELRELLEANAKRALALLAKYEADPKAKSQVNDARLLTLRTVSHFEEMALDKQALEVAKRLRRDSEKGTEHAAEADLFLVSADIRTTLRQALTGEDFQSAWTKNADAFRKKIAAYLDDHPKYVPAADALRGLLPLLELAGDTQTRDLVLTRVAKNLPEHPLARIAALRLAVGKPFDLQIPAREGQPASSLKDLRGKVVVVHFWASWCVPCATEVGLLRELKEKYKEKLAIVGVSLDEKEAAAKRFLTRYKADWPHILGKPAQALGTQYGIETLPTEWVIDREGILHSIDARGQLETVLEKLLK
jgi:thiol-disulfide isomerase/thioredoxin